MASEPPVPFPNSSGDHGLEPKTVVDLKRSSPVPEQSGESRQVPSAPLPAPMIEPIAPPRPQAEIGRSSVVLGASLFRVPSSQDDPAEKTMHGDQAELTVRDPRFLDPPVPMPTAVAERRAEVASGPRQPIVLPNQTVTILLRVVRGERLNIAYPVLEGRNLIGRSADKPVDIDLIGQEPDDQVWSSRQHALVTLTPSRLTIEDLNSLNGTFVNRQRIHPGQQRELQVGDIIQIGTVQLRVELAEPQTSR